MLSCRACHAPSGDEMRYCPTCGEPLHDDVPTRGRRDTKALPSGTVIGSYKLVEVIGEGGMGRVYLAEHTRLGRRVALKMLRSKFTSDPEAVKRFFAEARAVNKIAHENIVEVTDFVTSPDGISFYIMELLTGSTLSQLLESEGPIPLTRALPIAIQVASALAAAHEAGIVHRDLKPDNIFLARRGARRDVVKLLDFGIAKLMLADQGVSVQNTGAGMILGTPIYMSPEQAGGRAIDHRADIYSMGVILYELATGHAPFHGETYADILVQHMTTAPPPPNTLDTAVRRPVPGELEALILRCLAKDPKERPQTMAGVEEALTGLLEQQRMVGESAGDSLPNVSAVMPTPVIPLNTPTPLPMPVPAYAVDGEEDTELASNRRRSRTPVFVALALLLAGGGAAAFLILNRGDEPAPSAAPSPTAPSPEEPDVAPRPDVTPEEPPPAAAAAPTPDAAPEIAPPATAEQPAPSRPTARKPRRKIERKGGRRDRRIEKGGVVDAFDDE